MKCKTPSNIECEIPCPLLFCLPHDDLCGQTPEVKLVMIRRFKNIEAAKEKVRAKHRRYYWRHKAEIQAKYREANNESSRKYRANNRGTRLTVERNYRNTNKDEINRKRREKRRIAQERLGSFETA